MQRDPLRQSQMKQWHKRIGDNRRTIYRAANGVIKRPSIYDQLHKIKAPCVVLTGDEDQTRTLRESQRIVDAVAGARLVRVPNAGHMLPLEQPEAVNAALLEFLASLAHSPGAGSVQR